MTEVQLFHWLFPIFHSLNRNSFTLHAQKKLLFSRTLTNYILQSPLYIIYKTCFGLIVKHLLQPSTLVGSVHRSQPLVQNATAHFARRQKLLVLRTQHSQPSRCVCVCIFFTFPFHVYFILQNIVVAACLLSSQVQGASVFHEYNTYRTVVMFITNRKFCTSSSHNNRLWDDNGALRLQHSIKTRLLDAAPFASQLRSTLPGMQSKMIRQTDLLILGWL